MHPPWNQLYKNKLQKIYIQDLEIYFPQVCLSSLLKAKARATKLLFFQQWCPLLSNMTPINTFYWLDLRLTSMYKLHLLALKFDLEICALSVFFKSISLVVLVIDPKSEDSIKRDGPLGFPYFVCRHTHTHSAMAGEMFLYWGSGSIPCWKPMIVLEEKGFGGYKNKLVSFSNKEHKGEDVLKLNPRGQVGIWLKKSQ